MISFNYHKQNAFYYFDGRRGGKGKILTSQQELGQKENTKLNLEVDLVQPTRKTW